MAIGMTLIKYGNLTLFNVLTKYQNQENFRDETDSDVLGMRFTYSCVAQVHGYPAALTGVLPTTGDFDAANAMVGLRYLFTDRQHFELRMGVVVDSFGNIIFPGTLMLVCDPANVAGSTNVNLCDINNGPKAKLMNVTHVKADAILQVEVEFELSMLQCLPNGTTFNASGVLNNRWTVSDDINQNFMTTRTTTGKLRLSSAQVNPNSFRGLVMPPLQPGMRRDHIQMAASDDGLNLLYSITDKEIAYSAPAPATKGSFRFEEEVVIDGQLGFFSTADITLEGDRYCDHKQLISIASSMAIAKFSNGVRLANDNTYMVQSISIIDEWSDDFNGIHLRAVARRLDPTGPSLNGLQTAFLGVPISGAKISDVAASFDYRLSRGSRPGDVTETQGPISVVAAFSAFLQGPCQIDHSFANGLPANPGQVQTPPPVQTTTVNAVTNNAIPDDQTITKTYGPVNSQGMYGHWIWESHDSFDALRAQCPISQTAAGSSGSTGFTLGDAWWNGTAPPVNQQTGVVINLGPPQLQREVTVDAERVGAPPTTPQAKDFTDGNGVNWRVARQKKSIQNPRYTSDGKKVFRTQSSIFYYALNFAMSVAGGVTNHRTYAPPYTITNDTVSDPVADVPQ